MYCTVLYVCMYLCMHAYNIVIKYTDNIINLNTSSVTERDTEELLSLEKANTIITYCQFSFNKAATS